MKKLERIIEGEGMVAISRLPDAGEMMDKINEIVEFINHNLSA